MPENTQSPSPETVDELLTFINEQLKLGTITLDSKVTRVLEIEEEGTYDVPVWIYTTCGNFSIA
jgi:hypothetical protein